MRHKKLRFEFLVINLKVFIEKIIDFDGNLKHKKVIQRDMNSFLVCSINSAVLQRHENIIFAECAIRILPLNYINLCWMLHNQQGQSVRKDEVSLSDQ